MGTLLRNGIVTATLEELFLDPNNPRLALKDKPGYQNSDRLFDREEHNKIFETVINGNHDIVGDLVDKIIAIGWEDHNQLIAYQPKELAGQKKYLITEGNRRLTSLLYIHSKALPQAKKKYENAVNSNNPNEQLQAAEKKEYLDRVQSVVDATQTIYVKQMVAETPEEVVRDNPKLLSIIHLSGPKDWGKYERGQFVFETYVNLFYQKHSKTTPLKWDDQIERKTQTECNIKTLNEARKTIKAYQWFESFKSDYEDKLPNDGEFQNTDFYLFECILNAKWFREDVLKLEGNELKIPEDAANAIFEWSFKKERTHLSEDNENIFPRHQMIKELNTMHEKQQRWTPPYPINCYDIDEPQLAKRFDEVELDHMQKKSKQQPADVLSDLITKLKEIKGQELRMLGDTVRRPLEEIEIIIKDYLKMMDVTK